MKDKIVKLHRSELKIRQLKIIDKDLDYRLFIYMYKNNIILILVSKLIGGIFFNILITTSTNQTIPSVFLNLSLGSTSTLWGS